MPLRYLAILMSIIVMIVAMNGNGQEAAKWLGRHEYECKPRQALCISAMFCDSQQQPCDPMHGVQCVNMVHCIDEPI
jgi:hypothetical protein